MLSLDISFIGDYFDEMDGALNAEIRWAAKGLKNSDGSGDGQSAFGQSNRFWCKRSLTIANGEYVDLDLYGFESVDFGRGLGNDPLGLPIIMKQVTLLLIMNPLTNGTLTLGGAATDPWTGLFTGTITRAPGEHLLAYTRNSAGFPVTEGSSQFLRIASSGTEEESSVIDVYVVGRYF